MKQGKHTHRTWVEIDTKALATNVSNMKLLLAQEVLCMAVVKSNAYGHGMVLAAHAAIAGGADWLAVDDVHEALTLRAAKIRVPILVLGYTMPELYKKAIDKKISLTISSLDGLKYIASLKPTKRFAIHIKFDTGLHRQGILESHVQQALRVISAPTFPAVIEGVYTHFAAMESPEREGYSLMQIEAFQTIVTKLNAKGFTPITHASASSGILFSQKYNCDMARSGISIYGVWPSKEIKLWARDTQLIPVLSWKTRITEVKLISKGSKIGYDLTCEVDHDARIAIIPVGYWHGLPRSLSNKGEVLVAGGRAKILGRISMDMTIIDITDLASVKTGDEVVLIGTQGKEAITAEEMALKAGTINYEILTRINPLLPRIAV